MQRTMGGVTDEEMGAMRGVVYSDQGRGMTPDHARQMTRVLA